MTKHYVSVFPKPPFPGELQNKNKEIMTNLKLTVPKKDLSLKMQFINVCSKMLSTKRVAIYLSEKVHCGLHISLPAWYLRPI